MSSYHTWATLLTNRDSLEQAIAAVGLACESAPDNTLKMFSYFRTDNAQPACLVIRKEALDATWNDLGFALNPDDGTFSAIVGDDRRGPDTLRRITQEYAIIENTRVLQAQGYTVTRQEQAGGVVELVFEI